MNFVFGFIGLIIYLIVSAAAASEMQDIAEAKGATSNYWLWCFLFTFVGYFMVCALPDYKLRDTLTQNDAKMINNDEDEELPSL